MAYVTLDDLKALDKDELLVLLERSLFMIRATPADIASARWDVAAKRASLARQRALDLFEKRTAIASALATSFRRPKDMRTWTDVENRCAAAEQAAARAEKKADRLWKELEASWKASREAEARVA